MPMEQSSGIPMVWELGGGGGGGRVGPLYAFCFCHCYFLFTTTAATTATNITSLFLLSQWLLLSLSLLRLLWCFMVHSQFGIAQHVLYPPGHRADGQNLA